ncbi:bifunctional 4-hydroxy-2-oxoglutarate aldolase/2-dehydro-3-deoxy-phosphogluconate aldolase [Ferrimonas senticii]|uniref:bifunctional 4-hydroxy-2-oxoglutarate aldolase/2-dehydro-3-deoxy-phosphogluconate aldolase n=1 Tax=Ferrimonas senticii TaxID=394566 RepID=UPI0003F5B467|nr:bifunctional 4-hydroxy-2-oxoglutarate aldolase/2-dehydro-3-deoxy-phosphogluconate aldolase [Ferrimonas senticii]
MSQFTPEQIFSRSPVIPVLIIKRLEDALPLASALLRGGIDIIEITLRSECALAAISLIREQLPQMLVGAGTVLTSADIDAVVNAGGQFIVTPGATEPLLDQLRQCPIAVIPGISTVSEAMTARAKGFYHLKFFPAEACGGASTLAALAGPLSDIQFCATGGIRPSNKQDYLALAHVPCIGGTWLTPQAAIDAQDWQQISQLAAAAIQ